MAVTTPTGELRTTDEAYAYVARELAAGRPLFDTVADEPLAGWLEDDPLALHRLGSRLTRASLSEQRLQLDELDLVWIPSRSVEEVLHTLGRLETSRQPVVRSDDLPSHEVVSAPEPGRRPIGRRHASHDAGGVSPRASSRCRS